MPAVQGREEWPSFRCPVTRMSPSPGARQLGAEGGLGREADRRQRTTSGEMSSTSEPQSDARPAQLPFPVPETVNPRSPLQTGRHRRGSSSLLVWFQVPRCRSYFRNSRRITAHARRTAPALASTTPASWSACVLRFNVLAVSPPSPNVFTQIRINYLCIYTQTGGLSSPKQQFGDFPAVILPVKVRVWGCTPVPGHRFSIYLFLQKCEQ